MREHAERRPLDYVGAVQSLIGLALIIFALIQGQSLGWWTMKQPLVLFGWAAPLALGPGCLLLAVFARRELASRAVGASRSLRRDPLPPCEFPVGWDRGYAAVPRLVFKIAGSAPLMRDGRSFSRLMDPAFSRPEIDRSGSVIGKAHVTQSTLNYRRFDWHRPWHIEFTA
jgi:hypothetical protein